MGTLLGPLISLEESILEKLHFLGLGWGLAIVCLTLLTRAALLPLTIRQLRAQWRMAAHAPELSRLRARHGKDPDRLKRELLAYHREHGVSPLGALGPTLLQLPVFISLYFLMRTDVANGLFGHAGFLFIPDLTARPHGMTLVILIAGYLILQIASSAVATRSLEGGRRGFALMLPLVFVGVASRFPAGLLVYWITSSCWTLGQHLTAWRLGPAVAVAGGGEPSPPVVSVPRAPARAHPRSRKKHRPRGLQ